MRIIKPNVKPVYSIDVTGSGIVKNRYNINEIYDTSHHSMIKHKH